MPCTRLPRAIPFSSRNCSNRSSRPETFITNKVAGSARSLREWHIPRSVQDAVKLRTAHLSEGARQVLNLAAVAGRHFDFALLQALTHQDEAQLLRLLKELIAAQLVVEESAEQFAFRHALTRQAVYCGTPGARTEGVAPHDCRDLRASLRLDASRRTWPISPPISPRRSLGESAGVWPTCGRTGTGPLCAAGRHSDTSRGRSMPRLSCLSRLLQACTVRVGWPTKPWGL